MDSTHLRYVYCARLIDTSPCILTGTEKVTVYTTHTSLPDRKTLPTPYLKKYPCAYRYVDKISHKPIIQGI